MRGKKENSSFISDKKLWDEVGAQMGKPKSEDIKQIKEQLSFIVERRNKIAHEADIDPSYNIGQRWPIDEDMVNDDVTTNNTIKNHKWNKFLYKLIRSVIIRTICNKCW